MLIKFENKNMNSEKSKNIISEIKENIKSIFQPEIAEAVGKWIDLAYQQGKKDAVEEVEKYWE